MREWDDIRELVLAELTFRADSEEWDAVGDVVDQHFFKLLCTDGLPTVEILSRIPRPWLLEHPRYLMATSIAYTQMYPHGVVDASVQEVFEEWVYNQANAAPRDLLGVLMCKVRRALASGENEETQALIEQCRRVLAESVGAPGFDDMLPPILLQLGLAQLTLGQLRRAVSAFGEAWRWSNGGRTHPFGRIAADHMALTQALLGDYVEAEQGLNVGSPLPLADSMNASLRGQAGALARAMIAIAKFDQASTRDALPGLHLAITSSDLWWVALHVRARHELYWGDPAGAVRGVEHELIAYPSVTSSSSLAGVLLRIDLADLYQAQGEVGVSKHVLDELPTSPPLGHLARTSRARERLLSGNARAALSLIDEGLRDASVFRSGTPPQWMVVRANSELILGHYEIATENARQALELVARRGARVALVELDPLISENIGVSPALMAAAPFPLASRIDARLTPREAEALVLLEVNESTRDLAAAMFVSVNTAKTHLQSLYRKLGAHNRMEALERRRTPKPTHGKS